VARPEKKMEKPKDRGFLQESKLCSSSSEKDMFVVAASRSSFVVGASPFRRYGNNEKVRTNPGFPFFTKTGHGVHMMAKGVGIFFIFPVYYGVWWADQTQFWGDGMVF
jgi:hypothetical protein